MRRLIQIIVGDEKKITYIERNKTVSEIIDILKISKKKNIIAAIVNNEYYDLSDKISNHSVIKFIYINSEDGLKIYRDTMTHILAYAVKKIFGKDILAIGPSIRYNYYFDLEGDIKIDKRVLKRIEEEMWKIIKKDIVIKKEILSKDEGVVFYKTKKENYKSELIRTSNKKTFKFYSIDNFKELCDGPLAPSTGIMKRFKLILYDPGFLLVMPRVTNEKVEMRYEKSPKKLSKVFLETRNWYINQGFSTVADLNNIILNNRLSEIITISEALHDKKISEIADIITKGRKEIKIVLIAGPSSSGKTTFLKRLGIYLKVNFIKPVGISLDNYFIDRDKTPLDENGNYNFEALEALDLKLLNNHLTSLLAGKTVMLPLFDFHKGRRKKKRKEMKLGKDEILIIEGIHGLNEKLTSSIPKQNKFKIYVSALSQLRLSEYHRITTTDTRLLRRIVRDSLFRNHNAYDTLRMWYSVHRGEEKYIFPFQEDADIMFNSSLIYEISVLKPFVYKYLLEVPHTTEEYAEAKRLIDLLDYFVEASPRDVPKTSILREFIGGSSFKY